MVILGESSHLGRCFCSVEADDLFDHQGIGNTVRQMVERTQLVRHRVADAQERICKGHTGHGCGIRHLLTGLHIGLTILICPGQVLENVFQCLQSQTIGIVGSQHSCVGLHGMGHSVDAGCCGQTLGSTHVEIRIDDCHIGQQLIICQRILDARGFICDNSKRSYLRAGAGRGRNRNEIGLLAHLGEGIDSLADIDEAHCHIHEVCLSMLVEHPHDFGGIHGRSTAQCDNGIRLESSHLCDAFLGITQRGIRLDIEEGGVCNPHLIQLVGDGLGVAIAVQEGIRYDKCLLCLPNSAKLIQRNGQAALFDVDLFRRPEPQHVFPSFCHSLDIQQVLDTYIFRYGVTAPGTAAQCQRRSQLEIIQVADTTVRRRRIDQDTAGFHPLGKGIQFFGFGDRIQVDAGGMAITTVRNQLLGFIQCILKILGSVHGKDRRQLFMSKFFRKLHTLHFADQDLGSLGNCDSCQSGNLWGGLTNDLGVQCAVNDDGLAYLLRFLRVQEVAATVCKLCLDSIVDSLQNNNRLLGSADHTVVKGLGMDNGVHCEDNVCGVIDDCRSITGAHTQSRLAAGIGSLHHTGTTGCQNDIRFFHDGIGQLQTGNIDPVDNAFGCTCCDCSFQNQLRCCDGAVLCSGMGRNDDCIPGLQCNQALEDRGGSRIRCRNDRCNHTDGFSNFLNTEGLILFHHTAGLGIFICVVDVFSGIVVLDHLILNHTHTGFFHGKLCKRNSRFICSRSGCKENAVYLLLGKRGKRTLCGSRLLHSGNELIYIIHNIILFRFHRYPPVNDYYPKNIS